MSTKHWKLKSGALALLLTGVGAVRADLVHRYTFTANANDSVGTAHGTLLGGATVSGGALQLNGSGAYVDLPNNLVTPYTSITVEVWLVNNGSGNWARIFDFGNSSGGENVPANGTQYMFLTPGPGPGILRGAYTVTGGGAGEQIVQGPTALPTGTLKHVVWATDAATQLGRLYVDGVLVGSNTSMTITPAGLGPTLNNWIGRSQFSADAFLNASIQEFRIFNTALTANEIALNFQAGPDVVAIGGPVTITSQPQSQTVGELQAVTFSVRYNGALPASVQWFRNGSAIPGATNDSYTIASVALTDSGAVFNVRLTNVVTNTTFTAQSTDATLTVTADTTAPSVVRAISVFPTNVIVEFSEGVRADTATRLANYAITGPGGNLSITAVTLQSNQRDVLLTTAAQALGGSYNLTVSGIRDLSAASNLLVSAQASFVAVDYTTTNIGNATVTSTFTPVPGGYDYTGGGIGPGGNSDQFTFSYRLLNGDFDLQVRLGSLQLSDAWARAGLMARDGLATNAMFAASFMTPGPAGAFFASRTTVGGTASMAGSFPANYPDSWLRLRRVGNVFSGYASLDGQRWEFLSSATIAMSSTIQVGFALSSGNNSTPTTGQFRSLGAGTGILTTNAPLPFEPLGPSTRRTALVFSEFMYNPPSNWSGTNNLEFVELWNSGLVTEDLTGHRLTGDISFTFPGNTMIRPGQFLVVASDPAAAQSFYGVPFLGPYTNNLGNNDGTLRLVNEVGGRILEIEYDNEAPWPAAADGTGHSLVLVRPSYGENDPRGWAPSDVIGGSPGRAEHYSADPLRSVVINEFLANTDPPLVDYVELFNTGLQPVDISGAWLSDEPGTNKFRISNLVLQPRSFVSFDQVQLGFALSSDGEQVLLVNSNQTRVIDAVAFEGQATGVSLGRLPDGGPTFNELGDRTPGLPNGPPLARPVVFNEIMYHPISEDENDEFVELHNRSAGAVNLAGWRLDGGVRFTFPGNAVIPAGGYLVIAENLTNLLAKYAQLNAANTFGNYDGALANGGERLLLKMPEYTYTTNQGVITTNINFITVNEVDYRDGGRWGALSEGRSWSDGGGSSLELRDPRADNRYASSWADSDETAKAIWTTIDVTNFLENGQTATMINQGGYLGPPDRFEFYLQDDGEVLVDDLEFRNNNGASLVANGNFANGASGWTLGGTMRRSFVEAGVGTGGSAALHLIATDRGDAGPNKAWTAFTGTVVTNPPNTGTIRAQVKWQKGSPYILFRTRGHWMEVSRRLNVPSNCGTPGLPNSRLAVDAGPAITEVSHTPVLPEANRPVLVTARVSDPDFVDNVTLRYRVDPGASFVEVAMTDSGGGPDAVQGDDVYSAILPGRAGGSLVAFHIYAQDDPGIGPGSRFPNDAPARECLVRWGEAPIAGTIGTYRLWVTASNVTHWTNRERNANDPVDATFVYGQHRVIYNVKTLYSGSPFHAPNYNGPVGSFACDYEVNFNTDERFLGADDFVLAAFDIPSGNFFFQEKTTQADLTGNWIARKLGQPFNYRRHMHMIVNGLRRGTIYDDAQQPNGDWIEQFFPDDPDGDLRKIEDWFEFANNGQDQGITTATVERFNKSGGGIDTKRYRYNWRARATDNPDNWFAVTNLILAINDTGNANYVGRVSEWIDLPNFLRPIVTHHIVGDWDSYGYERGKNMYAYKPENGRWSFLMWDIELALGLGSRAATDGIYQIFDPVLRIMVTNTPAFHREYLRAYDEAVNTSLAPGAADALLDERYASLLANGLAVNSPQIIKNFIAQRRNYLLGQIPNPAFSVNGTNFLTVTASNLLVLSGIAPVRASHILVNGIPYPVTWTGTTTWTLRVPLSPGTNVLVVEAVDRFGSVLANGTRTITAVYNGAVSVAEGSVVFNEIMYQPLRPEASFLELHNTSTNYSFDLSGWRINGLSFTFPEGSIIGARGFLVLGENRVGFYSAYGTNVVFAQFDGALDDDGETLSLIKPGATPDQDLVVDRVRYEPNAPWSAQAAGAGASLQVIDPTQDNSRAGDWGSTAEWRYVTVSGIASSSRLFVYLTGIGNVFIDDMKLVAGTVAEVGVNRLANGDFEAPLAGTWTIPTGNQEIHQSTTNVHSGAGSLHLVSTNPLVVLSAILLQDISPALTTGQAYTLSYWYRPVPQAVNLFTRMSVGTLNGSIPLAPTLLTPGAVNFVNAPLPAFPTLWLNEVLAQNVNGLLDNHNEREPWVELYNSGASAVALDGLFLTANYANPGGWPFPGGAILNPGQFLIVMADGEPTESTQTELHTSFRLAPTNGSVALTRFVDGQAQVVDYLNYSGLAPDRSYGDFPDGQPFFRQDFLSPSPGGMNTNSPWAPLRINEWMASNTGIIRDPADNDTDDWFEIYNPTALPVNLRDWYLSDASTNLTQYRVPAGYVVPAGGYLLVWADGETGQNSSNRIDLHASFNLRAAGEEITLTAPDETLIDAVSFGQQANNISMGRSPDGSAIIVSMTAPSPRGANSSTTVLPPTAVISVNITTVVITFNTTPGRSYRVEYKDVLNAVSWTELAPAQAAVGPSMTVTDTLDPGLQRFYRVVLLP